MSTTSTPSTGDAEPKDGHPESRDQPASDHPGSPAVERLFPFALRARILVVGRDALRRSKRKLLFVLITADLSANSRQSIKSTFHPLPIIERYTSADVERLFNLKATKVVGFRKSSLAQSIYRELKAKTEQGGETSGGTSPEPS
jgi:hypothetical protein